MPDLNASLARLFRPRSLVRAARYALPHYNRHRHLQRLLGPLIEANSAQIARQLTHMEAEQNEKRRAADASYSPAKHIEVLCALMAEAELLAKTLVLPPKKQRPLH